MNTECCFSCFEIMKNISRVQIPWFLIEVVLTLQLVQVRLWFPWLSSQKLCEPNCHSELHLFITHTTNLVTTVYLKYKQVGTFFFEKTKKKPKTIIESQPLPRDISKENRLPLKIRAGTAPAPCTFYNSSVLWEKIYHQSTQKFAKKSRMLKNRIE